MKKILYLCVSLLFSLSLVLTMSVRSVFAQAPGAACGVVIGVSNPNQICSCPGHLTPEPMPDGSNCCGWRSSVEADGCAESGSRPIGCGTVSETTDPVFCTCRDPNTGNLTNSSQIGLTNKQCCGWVDSTKANSCSNAPLAAAACGTFYDASDSRTCGCRGGSEQHNMGNNKICCGFTDSTAPNGCGSHIVRQCGDSYDGADLSNICGCATAPAFKMSTGFTCCGWPAANGGTGVCNSSNQSIPGGGGTTPGDLGGVTTETFKTFNAAIFGGAPDAQLTTPRGFISKLLPYLLTLGGLILFIMLIWGGFEMLTGAANPKSQEAGKQRMTAAIIGFILLFSSYWLAQLVQTIFGIQIL